MEITTRMLLGVFAVASCGCFALIIFEIRQLRKKHEQTYSFMEKSLEKLKAELAEKYWTKEVIKRTLLRGPLEKDKSYEEWLAIRTGERPVALVDDLFSKDAGVEAKVEEKVDVR